MEKSRYFKYLKNESDRLLGKFLENYFFDNFSKPPKRFSQSKRIELFTTAKCTSACNYCYLKKQGNKLYPSCCDNEKDILKNLDIFMKYYVDHQFKAELEVFGGEGITTGLTLKSLDIIYNHLSKAQKECRPSRISLPEDCQFINSVELTEKVQEYIDKFHKIGISLTISLSVDGKFMDVNRSKKDDERLDEYYDRLFKFADKNYLGAHPMVSANNIDKWIDNYKWWWEQSEKTGVMLADRLMMLEVRNGDWTEEKIYKFLEFLNYLIDFYWERDYKHQPEEFAKRIIIRDSYPSGNYDNISLPFKDLEVGENTGLTCGIQEILTVRLGDLAICGCHRTCYDIYTAGNFIVENDKIVSISANNVGAYIAMLTRSQAVAPVCKDCPIVNFCIGPCLGANYEDCGDLFIPHESVCNLMKAKIMFLLIKYEDLGILDEIYKRINPREKEIIQKLLLQAEETFTNYATLFGDKIEFAKKNQLPVSWVKL